MGASPADIGPVIRWFIQEGSMRKHIVEIISSKLALGGFLWNPHRRSGKSAALPERNTQVGYVLCPTYGLLRIAAGLVYVTAFPNRTVLGRSLGEIAWETEVWVADAPSHLIHFNGERFLGPYNAR